MNNYELVLLLDNQSKDSDRKELLSKFEKDFKENILKKDDMWIQDLSFDIKWKKWNNRAYFISYHIQSDTDTLKDIKKMFLYTNTVVRYSIFKMNQEQTFFEYEKLKKELEKIMDSWDQKRFGNRISFLSHTENSKYINWKSIPILEKYLTRFATIKPRKYTKNPVKLQKKLRREIIRARTLWMLDFSKS